jgi:GAF domain-containing protein
MTPERFGERYVDALAAFVADPGEEALNAGHDVGRAAVRERLRLIDLAAVHHRALVGLCSRDASAGELVQRAGVFFAEALAAFEMLQRVLERAHEDATSERREAAVVRRVSNFLADTSIALDGASSVAEILQLVVEHALETVPAAWCTAWAELDDGELRIDAIAHRDEASGRPRIAEPVTLAAPLRTHDGRDLGSLRVFATLPRTFGELDEALLAQLAQMASAAIERAELYRRAA